MRRRVRKLELNRETLRRLAGIDTQTAWGGRTGPHQISEVDSACPLDCETEPGPRTVAISICIDGQPWTCDGGCFD